VAVPPTLHVIFILTATPLFLLVVVCHRPRIYAAHSSIGGRLSRGCRQSSSVCVESLRSLVGLGYSEPGLGSVVFNKWRSGSDNCLDNR